MPQNRAFSFSVQLSSTLTTNLFNPGTTTGGIKSTSAPFNNLRAWFRLFRIVNTSGTAATVSLYKGVTGANAVGTEIILGKSVPANDEYLHWMPDLPFDVTDFLVGGSGTNNVLTLYAYGQQGIA